MKYKYHCQQQAEDFARSILPVPEHYPLQDGLSEDFPRKFAKLCELMKSIYLDAAENPKSYGLKLIDIESDDNSQIRSSLFSIHRFADTLNVLFLSGSLRNSMLAVSVNTFNHRIKDNRGADRQSAVLKYELVLSRLVDFGFVFSEFDGKPYSNDIFEFTVEYPDDPEIMDTLNDYFRCWEILWIVHEEARLAARKIKSNAATNFEHCPFEDAQIWYRFDYKITADRMAIPVRQWILDNIMQTSFLPEFQSFAVAFYDYSLNYPDIKFNIANAIGEYHYKSSRIARTMCDELSLKLPKLNKSANAALALPDSVQNVFRQDYPGNCNKIKRGGECSCFLKWTFEDIEHKGCPQRCFLFDDFSLDLVEGYWKLLEEQYGLRRR